jgi:hypothetical protein
MWLIGRRDKLMGHLCDGPTNISPVTPFSELSPYHTGHPTRPKELLYLCGTGWPRVCCSCTAQVGRHCIVPYHTGGPAGRAILYLYCTGRPRAMTHGSPYHIYHLPIWVIHLNTFDMELTIYVWDSFFNVNSMVMFVL